MKPALILLLLTGCTVNDYSDATCSSHFRAARDAHGEPACTQVSKPLARMANPAIEALQRIEQLASGKGVGV